MEHVHGIITTRNSTILATFHGFLLSLRSEHHLLFCKFLSCLDHLLSQGCRSCSESTLLRHPARTKRVKLVGRTYWREVQPHRVVTISILCIARGIYHVAIPLPSEYCRQTTKTSWDAALQTRVQGLDTCEVIKTLCGSRHQ